MANDSTSTTFVPSDKDPLLDAGEVGEVAPADIEEILEEGDPNIDDVPDHLDDDSGSDALGEGNPDDDDDEDDDLECDFDDDDLDDSDLEEALDDDGAEDLDDDDDDLPDDPEDKDDQDDPM